MKKPVRIKRHALDKGASVITSLVLILEDDDEWDFIKKEDRFMINLDKNKKMNEDFGVNEKIESWFDH